MSLNGEADVMVAFYLQARIEVYCEKIAKSRKNIQAFLAESNTNKLQVEIRTFYAYQQILRELIYAAKYLLSKNTLNQKITYDTIFLDHSYWKLTDEELTYKQEIKREI